MAKATVTIRGNDLIDVISVYPIEQFSIKADCELRFNDLSFLDKDKQYIVKLSDKMKSAFTLS